MSERTDTWTDEDTAKYFDKMQLEHSDTWLWTHQANLCSGQFCTVHNRSDHSMRSFPQHWRGDRGIMERICSHGTGHPDPDEFKLTLDESEGVHGCCGCCAGAYKED